MENTRNKKINIGVLFPPRRGNGGIFQYVMSIAEALMDYCPEYSYTILHFENDSPKNWLKIKNFQNINFVCLSERKNNLISKAGIFISILTGRPIFMIGRRNKELLKNAKIDLIIPPSPQLAGFEYNIPYILPIPDMMYKHYHADFPEYSSLKSRIISDVFFKHLAKHSELCVADSKYGRDDIVKFLNQNENKVEVIPFVPPGYVYYYKDMSLAEAEDALKKYNLPEKFIFYPAQFWPHKNHLRLIESIGILKERYKVKVNLVLAGNPQANADNYSKIKELIKKLQIEDQVFISGYVLDKEIVALYKRCLALVFTSFGGPTNIPMVEAMVLGVPVLCSNLFAMPEQAGDAGLLFDPKNPDDMALKINQVWQDENLRKQMIEKGYAKAKDITFENYANMWILAVKKALSKI